jgi:hypothetical protein
MIGADEAQGVANEVTIVRAEDGSVGLRFLRPNAAASGPFEVTRTPSAAPGRGQGPAALTLAGVQVTGLVPNSPAERSGAVRKGDLLCEVDGHDVSMLDEASVANLFRGAPSSPFALRILSKSAAGLPADPVSLPAMSDSDVAAAIAWAGRSGRLQAQHAADFEALLHMLKPVALLPAQVCSVHARRLMLALFSLTSEDFNYRFQRAP